MRAVVLDVRTPCMWIRGGADPTVALARAWRTGIALLGTFSTTVDLRIRCDAAIVAGDAAIVDVIVRVTAVVALRLTKVVPLRGGR